MRPGELNGIFGSGPPSRVAPRLWQGGLPKDFRALYPTFDVLVLAARELQPTGTEVRDLFPRGLEVVLAPMDDSNNQGPTAEEASLAVNAADRVARAIREGKRVLTTCAQGRNRSGLVNALALHLLYGISGREAIGRIRAARQRALTNDGFCDYLEKIEVRG